MTFRWFGMLCDTRISTNDDGHFELFLESDQKITLPERLVRKQAHWGSDRAHLGKVPELGD